MEEYFGDYEMTWTVEGEELYVPNYFLKKKYIYTHTL